MGPLMIDLESTVMNARERQLLMNPAVAGVILFTRNYESPEQLAALTQSIRAARSSKLLIAVDHEGGRVQRFRSGFSAIPAAGALGRLYDEDKPRALKAAEYAGWLMASELRAVGIDFSFAPVLDLDVGISDVIGDRAFHSTADGITQLSLRFVYGMKQAGMIAVAKHFPGHGSVKADSHVAYPIDQRSLVDLQLNDLLPFQRHIQNHIAAIMPAHVIYPQVDVLPAGFSAVWIQQILRQQMGFAGAVISDDISMQAADVVGDYSQRVATALNAGCDLILLCNHPEDAQRVCEQYRDIEIAPDALARRIHLYAHNQVEDLEALHLTDEWQAARDYLAIYCTAET